MKIGVGEIERYKGAENPQKGESSNACWNYATAKWSKITKTLFISSYYYTQVFFFKKKKINLQILISGLLAGLRASI